METPFKHTNKTFIFINEEYYAFGTCTDLADTLFNKLQPCYMAFENRDTICFGKDAYNSSSRIRFPVFANPEKIQETLKMLEGHHIQKVNLRSRGLKIEGSFINNEFPVCFCYDLMINYIIDSFVKAVAEYNYTADEVVVFFPTGLNDILLKYVQNLLLAAAHHHKFKIQFVNASEALRDRLSLRECNSMDYQPSGNSQFLTIDIGTEHTRLEFFKGKHAQRENGVELMFNSKEKIDNIFMTKSEFDRIRKSVTNIDSFDFKCRDDQLIIENEFRSKFGMKNVNSRVYCVLKIYKSHDDDFRDDLIQTVSLTREEFDKIPNDLYAQLGNFDKCNKYTQRNILKELEQRIGRPNLFKIDGINCFAVIDVFNGFSLPLAVKTTVRKINFYDIESVEEQVINFGNFDFENKYLDTIENVTERKFIGPIESSTRNRIRANTMDMYSYFATKEPSTFNLTDLDDNNVSLNKDEVIDALRDYFAPLFASIREFIDKNYDAQYSKELRYIFVDGKNFIFKRIFNETFVNEMENINMIYVNSNDGDQYLYKGGSAYLYNHQHDFQAEIVSQEVLDEYCDRYLYFGDWIDWLKTNKSKHSAITTKITLERNALKKIYAENKVEFSIKVFNEKVNMFRVMNPIAENFQKDYVSWRQSVCPDHYLIPYIPEDKRLF